MVGKRKKFHETFPPFNQSNTPEEQNDRQDKNLQNSRRVARSNLRHRSRWGLPLHLNHLYRRRRIMTKAPKTFPKAFVTLGEIDLRYPCFSEYCAFLKDHQSNRVVSIDRTGWEPTGFPIFKKSRFTKKSKILLSTILRSRGRHKADLTPVERVQWLLRRIPRLRRTYLYLVDHNPDGIYGTFLQQSRILHKVFPLTSKT